MADFDNITIQITARATTAINALDKLEKSLNAVSDALDRLDPSRLNGVADATEKVNKVASELKTNSKAYDSVSKGMDKAASSSAKMTDTSERVGKALKNLGRSSNEAKAALKGLSQSAGEGGSNRFKKFSDTIKKIGKEVSNSTSFFGMLGKAAKGVFKVVTAPATLAAKAMRSFGKDNSSTAQTARTLAKELLRVSKMFKLMITRMVLRQIIKGIGDGFKNLAQYSNQVNASMSLLWNSFRQLGNSIAAAASPLLNAFAPALNYIIQLVIKAVNAINQLLSALTGLGTWTRAKTLTDSYAASLDKSNKSAKKLKKTVLGFDELNQLQDNKNNGGGGTSPADMFEQVPIEDKWKEAAEKIKKIWAKLIKPIKKAWEDLGDIVKASWTRALKSIWTLAKDIGNDFLKVWNQEKTVEMFRNVLRIIADIGDVVHFLAKNFDEAWNKNNVGLHILEKIRDLFAIIIDHVENMTSATVEWAKELNFSPILEAFDEWLDSLTKTDGLVDSLMGTLEDFYTKALLPIGKWAVEEGGKELIKVFTDFNNEVKWDVIRERLNKVWEALAPFAKKVGEGLIQFIDETADALKDFLNSEAWDTFVDSLIKWMNNVKAEDIANGLDKISAALAGYLILKGLESVTTAISGLMATISSTYVVGNIIAVIAEVATTIALLTNNIKDYKKALGEGSLWDALFKRNPEDNARRQAYAEAKSSNPYNGNRQGEFKLSNLWKAFTDDAPVKAATDAALAIDKLGDSYQGAYIHAAKYDDTNSLLMQHLTGQSNSAKTASGSFYEYAGNVNKVSESLNNAGKVTPVLTDGQKKYEEALKKTSQTSAGAKTAVDNLKNSSDKYSGVAPKLTKSQQDIINSLEGVKVETVNVTTETENASLEMSGAWQEFSLNADKYSKDAETSISDSMDEVNKSLDSVKDGMTEDKWTFNGVIEGFKKTFKGIKDAVAPIWNEIADTLNGEHKTGNGFLGIHLPRFANGGFPENGLLFANSTEMVGRFSNGKNVVANNEQITNGIAQAVYSAMVSAQSSGGGQYINNTIMVDGEVLARTVTKGQEKMNRRYSPTMA